MRSKTEQVMDAYRVGYRTLENVGLELGVTRERVRQLLVKARRDFGFEPPKVPKTAVHLCAICGRPVMGRKTNRHMACHVQPIECECWQCHRHFLVSPSDYRARMRSKRFNETAIFCSHSCSSKYQWDLHYNHMMQNRPAAADKHGRIGTPGQMRNALMAHHSRLTAGDACSVCNLTKQKPL